MKKVLLPAALILLVWGCSKKMTPAKSETPSSNNGSAPIMGKTSSDISTPSTNTTATTTGAVASKDSPTYGAKTVERGGSADAAAIAGQATFNATVGTYPTITTLSTSTTGYLLKVATTNGTGGSCAPAAGYTTSGSDDGGALSTAFQIAAAGTASTAGDTATFTERARVATTQTPAADYTDTLTVVAAGMF